jgi:23S rRNA (pseudouridine1915-N3)-methyltransferase
MLILCAERSRRSAVATLCDDYLRRLERYNIRATLDECTRTSGSDRAHAIEQQTQRVLDRIEPDDYVVVLDERGTQLSSDEFARLVERVLEERHRRIVFVVGGAYGIGERLRRRADTVLSLGRMTLPHELARVVLCEQLYRALTILRGEPYHHGATDE